MQLRKKNKAATLLHKQIYLLITVQYAWLDFFFFCIKVLFVLFFVLFCFVLFFVLRNKDREIVQMCSSKEISAISSIKMFRP